MDVKTATALLSSLAQEARLNIFRLLVQAGRQGLPAGQIGEALSIPASTLSFHLKALSHAGLIKATPSSRYIYYTASYETMNTLMTFMTENCCAGEHCITQNDCSEINIT